MSEPPQWLVWGLHLIDLMGAPALFVLIAGCVSVVYVVFVVERSWPECLAILVEAISSFFTVLLGFWMLMFGLFVFAVFMAWLLS